MTMQNNISLEHKPVSFRELAKLKNENLENSEVKIEKPVDQRVALLDHLKTVTETPGVFSRTDQRNFANVAEKSKLLIDPNVKKEREANENYVAQLRAKRAKKENIVEVIKPAEINPVAATPAKIQPVVAEVDATGSTMLSDELPAKVLELAKSPDASIVPLVAENPLINTPNTGVIMSETAAPVTEIAVETAKAPEIAPLVADTPIPAPIAEVASPVVSLAEQFGVADVPLADVPAVETPIVVPIEPPVETVAAPPVAQEVATPIVPVVPAPEIKVPETVLSPATPIIPVVSAPEIKVLETVLSPAAPIIEEKTAEIVAEIPVVPPTEPVAEVVPPTVPVPVIPPAIEVATSVPDVVPVAVNTSANHKNISSLPNDSLASAYANFGGGGVELPAEEEKKK